MFDVLVVGGGPAGAVAAYRLAKRSLKVALIEKEAVPRYKSCGGAIPPHVDKLLDFSIDHTIERSITRAMVSLDLGTDYVTEAPRPFARMVMRDTFDAYLLEAAANAGAEVYQESPLVDLDDQGSYHSAKTPEVHINARYVIGADGAYSATRKLIGAPRHQRSSIAISCEILSSPTYLDRWSDTIALDFGHLISGYAWIFPKAGNFSAGAVGPETAAKQLTPYCRSTVRHYGETIGSETPYITAAHHLPIRAPGEAIVYGRTLLVGDAAGLIEPMVGEGIYYAIQSANLAADTILEAMDSDDQHLVDYQRKVDQQIQPEIQVSKALLTLLDLSPRFWVPRLLRQNSPFWEHFHRIFTGERSYQDLTRGLGRLGRSLVSALARD